jgi:putative thiamine transport system substrate-binding protein
VSYPRPPDFHGLTFLKQILLDTTPSAERAPLYRNVTPVAFARLTAALWRTLDKLHPKLWRAGNQVPSNAASQRQMMADGELLFALTFNPNEAANEIAASRLSPSTISYQFASGTIGNTHFLAIPFNTRSSAAAQVFANFLLGPEAQARKADISVWGDPTVLAIRRLPPAQRALFEHAMRSGEVASTMATLPEPHGSWVTPIQDEWIRRYGV